MTEIKFDKSKHAPLLERYSNGSYRKIAEMNLSGRAVDEEGREHRILIGHDGSYNRDFEIGPVYGETVFITAYDPVEDRHLNHEEISDFMQEYEIWPGDAVVPVWLPDWPKGHQAAWQFRPPERVPYDFASPLESAFGENVTRTGNTAVGWVEP